LPYDRYLPGEVMFWDIDDITVYRSNIELGGLSWDYAAW
jgi:hypothetical protein